MESNGTEVFFLCLVFSVFVSSLNLPPFTCFSKIEALSFSQPRYLQLLILMDSWGLPVSHVHNQPKFSHKETSCKDLDECN